jgi:glutathione synthase/RimK-type ligase-like ATP-grasp enzyme
VKARVKPVALVTYAQLPNLAEDDRLLLEPLRAEGLRGVPVRWDDPAADWAAFAAVLPRSPWDYYRRPAEFEAWLARLEASGARVLNPVATLRWNLRKDYLRRLEARGVEIVPTAWIDAGDPRSLAEVLSERGWRDAVVKPVFSAGGYLTWRARRDESGRIRVPSVAEVLHDPYALAGADGSGGPPPPGPNEDDEGRALWARTREAGPLMVQPFVDEILEHGEHSFLFFGGEFSHALVKRARSGEFRVQNEHGGTIHAEHPSNSDILGARRVLDAVIAEGVPTPLYARIDLIRTRAGGWWLGEIELLEPTLYFGWGEGSAERFARALRRRLA